LSGLIRPIDQIKGEQFRLTTIAVLLESKLTDESKVAPVVSALQTQVHEHFGPIWGVDVQIQFVPNTPPPGSWWLVLLDDTDQADALGYHDTTDGGLPLGKVFLKSCATANVSWTVTASHELLEMLADPAINLTVLHEFPNPAPSKLYSYEVCDPCEGDEFGYKIGDILVSDFVCPAWFESFHQPRSVRFDYCGRITEPFQLLAGGYASVLDVSTNGTWTQVQASAPPVRPGARLLAISSRSAFSTYKGSRRERRRRGRSNWKKSDDSKLPSKRTNRSLMGLPWRRRVHAVGFVPMPPTPAVAPAAAAAPSTAGTSAPVVARTVAPATTQPVPSVPAPSLSILTSTMEVKEVAPEIQKGLDAISSKASTLPNSAAMISTLTAAKGQLVPAPTDMNATLTGAVPDGLEISLVLSSINGSAGSARQIRTMDLVGTQPYEELDPGWAQSLYNRLVSQRVPFPTHLQRNINPCLQISNNVKIAIAGDWGTGNASSLNIGNRILDLKADHTIHLGDVYYSGTDDEENNKFIGQWPAGKNASAPSFTLNGNHEMYSGGEAYFLDVLMDPQFQTQQGLSYFALTNDNWIIFGLDTAYYAESFTYQKGFLDPVQLGWLHDTASTARAAGKRVIVLTHHNGIDLNVDPATKLIAFQSPLWDQVIQALDGGPDYWYWGHVHAGIGYKPVVINGGRSVRTRCVGHGGVPYAPYSAASSYGSGSMGVVFTETGLAGDPNEPRRALNGFMFLTFDGSTLHEEFRDENGDVRMVL
jgi:hypothetical protein